MAGIGLGGYRSDSEIEFCRRLFLQNMLSHTARPIAARARTAAPTPIPAFAPVESPPPPFEESAEEVASEAPGVLVVVSCKTLVEADVPVTIDVIVVKLGDPPDAVVMGATYVERKVEVDNTTDELDVVRVDGAEEDDEAAELADERLDRSEDDVKIGATTVEELAMLEEMLVDTVVEVLVETSVVELMESVVSVEEDVGSTEIVDVTEDVKDDTLELVNVVVEDEKVVDRFDTTLWPRARAATESNRVTSPRNRMVLAHKHDSMREGQKQNHETGATTPTLDDIFDLILV